MRKRLCSPIFYLTLTGIFAAVALLLWWYAATQPGREEFGNMGGSIMLTLSIAAFIAAIIFAVQQLPSTPSQTASLPRATEEALERADFSARTVLVGTVRTPEQLDYCLAQRKYYAPAKYFASAPFPTLYIALHEQEIGTPLGIRWVGLIETVELTERKNIPVSMRPDSDPQEIYYLFTLERWEQREPAITIIDSRRGRPRFTSKFLLDHCSKSYQLFSITNKEEFHLAHTLDRVYDQLAAGSLPDAPYRLGESHILTVKEGYVYILGSSGWVKHKTPIDRFLANPKATLERAKKIIRK